MFVSILQVYLLYVRGMFLKKNKTVNSHEASRAIFKFISVIIFIKYYIMTNDFRYKRLVLHFKF